MTIEKARKIIDIWGKHLQYCSKLNFIFGTHLPESLLPFPKSIIEEASDIMAEYYHKNGNEALVRSIEECKISLVCYIDDEEAILESVKFWNEPKWREVMLPSLKKFQKDWISTLKDF